MGLHAISVLSFCLYLLNDLSLFATPFLKENKEAIMLCFRCCCCLRCYVYIVKNYYDFNFVLLFLSVVI